MSRRSVIRAIRITQQASGEFVWDARKAGWVIDHGVATSEEFAVLWAIKALLKFDKIKDEIGLLADRRPFAGADPDIPVETETCPAGVEIERDQHCPKCGAGPLDECKFPNGLPPF